MTLEQITTLVASQESETLEFKSTTGTRREAAKTMCAMLNHSGGYVLFGVSPDGDVVGQQVSDRTIEGVSAEIQRIDPPAFPEVNRVPVAGDRELVVVRVNRGSARPYMYQGVAYRRVGNTTLALSSDEYNRMLFERMHSERRWENQPATGWSIDDLDVSEIRRTVAEAVRRGRLEDPGTQYPIEMLRGLGLYRDGILWRAAVVLFGKAERIEFEMPQCLLRVARFRGVDRSDFLDNRQFHGNAFALLANAERFLRETLPIAGRFESGRFDRIDEPLYPPLATRESLANALCHRDYSIGGGSVGVAVYDDRLEVTSSGTLHFGLTPAKLFEPHESVPWNPLIARTFYRRGIIEEWGRGTLKMAELTTSAGLPRPEIEDAGGCVRVRFRPAALTLTERVKVTDEVRVAIGRLPERQREILAVIDQAGRAMALREIHAELGPQTTKRRLREDLATLRACGLVTSTGHGRGARWTMLEKL